ncbi:hypothetical protein OY671_007383 [Metschnikowia pulcherrima]|nr:hypothetical protein OY671_007383 [Metschnikowia pulcherrima]
MTADRPFPSSVESVSGGHASSVDTRAARPSALEAAVAAMAPATRGAITADLRCFLAWCKARRPVATAVPAEPETLVHYSHWSAKGSDTRVGAKPATLARRIASIARIHRILGFGEREPSPTQAGMVRDTSKGIRRKKRERQRQAAPLRLGEAMQEGQAPPDGVTVNALSASCGTDIIGSRDSASISLAYDAGLRVSESVGATVADLSQVGDGSGRLEITHSKTDQSGEGASAWSSADTMVRSSAWLLASGIAHGPVLRRINVSTSPPDAAGQRLVRHYIGAKPLTRQGVVAISRRRVLEAIDLGHVDLEPGMEGDTVRALSAHSFRVGSTQDSFAAGEDGAGIASASRWSSPTTASRYARESAVGNNAAARVSGRLRDGDGQTAA